VWAFPVGGGVTTPYFGVVMAVTIFNSFASTIQFVGLGSYFTQISDPMIGGTYMTLLNTFSNLGGTWPKYFVLQAVDHLTVRTCELATGASGPDPASPPPPSLSCGAEGQLAHCRAQGGTCRTVVDGYYVVGVAGVVVGLCSLLLIRPQLRRLEALPAAAWRYTRNQRQQ
jgi:PAT family acetyl-CoA transporter-like MFS transporter 1